VGFADRFLHDFDWRDGRPKLAKWYESFSRRESMQSTKAQPSAERWGRGTQDTP
jgi:hypothetical protein